MLAELPEEAVLIVWGADRGFPVTYRQVVHGDRPDIDVVAGDGLAVGWYRDDASERLDLLLASTSRDAKSETIALIERLGSDRPVFLDARASAVVADQVGFVPRGLTAQVVDGVGQQPLAGPSELDRLDELVDALDRTPGLHSEAARRWPSEELLTAYTRTHVLTANAAALAGDRPMQRRHLEAALALDPTNATYRRALAMLDAADVAG